MIEDPYIEPTGRPLKMTFRVQRITRVGDHGYWVRCQAVTKRMDPFIFWLEPGSALPPIGLEFKATFDWNQEHLND